MTDEIRVLATWEDDFNRGKRKVLCIKTVEVVDEVNEGSRLLHFKRRAWTEDRPLSREDFGNEAQARHWSIPCGRYA